MALLNFPEVPDPTYVMSQEGYKIATYCWGDDDAPVVFAVLVLVIDHEMFVPKVAVPAFGSALVAWSISW